MSSTKHAASVSPAKTSWMPRTERTGQRMPVQVRSGYTEAMRAARANAAGRISSASAAATEGCTGPVNNGAASAGSNPSRPTASTIARPIRPIIASERMVSSMPAKPGRAAPPRIGWRTASSTAVPLAETSVTPRVASAWRAARSSATKPPSECPA